MAEDQASPTPQESNMALAPDQGDGAEIVECPTCHNRRRKFLIVDDKCDSCRTKGAAPRIVPELGWPEVRARRDRILASTDSCVLPDRKSEVVERILPIREELRDITGLADPITAWQALDQIEAKLSPAI